MSIHSAAFVEKAGRLMALIGLTLPPGILAVPRHASAGWLRFGQAICTAAGDQVAPVITTDGAAGAIIAWVDFRDPVVNVYARRVRASGDPDPGWPLDGRMLMTDPLALTGVVENPAFAVITSDGAGGAIVAWQHGRTSTNHEDIFAQHVLASGAVDPAWPPNGVALCVTTGTQDIPAITSDGAGGAIVTWMDGRSSLSSIDIYAQHVLHAGVVDPAWPVNGRALCTAPAPQAFPEIVPDGAGGAIVTWYDFRSSTTSIDIYAQRVRSSGIVDPAWPVDGRAVCTATGAQQEPRLVSDGAGGAIITWYDARSGANRVFAHRVLASGAVDPAWPVNGRALTDGTLIEEFPRLAADGAGGAVVTWQARESGVLRLFAQHVTAAGTVDAGWPVRGVVLTPGDVNPSGARIVPDGAGGAIVGWEQNLDIVAHHVLASGALDPAYPAAGRAICDLPSQQRDPAVVASVSGGAIVTWMDGRNGPAGDIFALEALVAAVVGIPEPGPREITFIGPVPNPGDGRASFRFFLPHPGDVRLAVYDPIGREVRELAAGPCPAGEHVVEWDLRDARGYAVGPGLYFARLEAGRLALTRKIVRLR